MYKRQRVHKVQNGAKDRSLKYAGGEGTNCRADSVDAHPEGSVAEIRPEEKHYGRWYGGVGKFEEKTFVPDFIEGLAPVSYTHLDVYKRQGFMRKETF